MLVVTGDSVAVVEKVTVFPEANPEPLKLASKFDGVNAVVWCPFPSVTPIANPGKLPSAPRSGEEAVMVVTASETRTAVVGLPLLDESKLLVI